VSELALLAAVDDEDDGRLDLLLNNAGVLHSGERFGSVSAALLDDSLRTNASGPLLLTQALAPRLADGAKVANLSSIMGSIAGRSEFRAPSYCISKAAQNMATALLARALAPRGIVVLALHPGWVQTDMGGDGAQISAAESVTALLALLDGVTLAHSGQFLDWQGQSVPW
jgi:NAD(P)-dependent dehydrogenase (short-subunit alcohol dehydrogenase family)